jgi:hypothetical protein
MSAFQLALMILTNILAVKSGNNGQAVTEALGKLTTLYNELREAASQNQELTPEQEVTLDAHAEFVFAADASDPTKNA